MRAHIDGPRSRHRVRAGMVTLALAAALAGFVFPPPVLAVPTTVNVEIDYMADASHSHRPQGIEIPAIVQMFACHGITLNVVIDDSIPHVATMVDGPASNDFFTAPGPGRFATMKAAYFDHPGGGWHYCIFGHDYTADGLPTGSSGLAEILGDDLVVTLGSFFGGIGTPFDRASSFAHELGHNLGLTHNAGIAGVGKYPPNYASIMSYQYQLTGVRQMMLCTGMADETSLLKNIDYSSGRLPDVNENSLNEATGLGIHRTDWNCDGSVGGIVSMDLDNSYFCYSAGARNTPKDKNDWAALADCTFVSQVTPREIVTCITAQEQAAFIASVPESVCYLGQPGLIVEACLGSGRMIWVDPTYSGVEDGTGSRPFDTFLEGYNPAPAGSVLYLQPGTLTATGVTLRLTKAATIAGPGGARIDP